MTEPLHSGVCACTLDKKGSQIETRAFWLSYYYKIHTILGLYCRIYIIVNFDGNFAMNAIAKLSTK